MPRKNILYFVCPTDYLEVIINNTFEHENYYYTSLCNSIVFNTNIIGQIIYLIKIKNIQEISFVLANDNRILLDALGEQEFLEESDLNDFYQEISKRKEYFETSWHLYNHRFSVISYHLNNKINELKQGLDVLFDGQLKISGKIYDKKKKVFRDIYSDAIYNEYYHLN